MKKIYETHWDDSGLSYPNAAILHNLTPVGKVCGLPAPLRLQGVSLCTPHLSGTGVSFLPFKLRSG